MPSSKSSASTKKGNILKVKRKTVEIKNDNIFTWAIKDARVIENNNDQITFDTLVEKLEVDDIQSMKQFIKTDKSNLNYKIPRLLDKTQTMSRIIQVRDWLTQVIEKSNEMTTDAVVNALDEDEGDVSKDAVLKLLDIHIGIKKRSSKMQS
eukprot:Skav227367  [mRNA]  locus=scaffold2373:89604:90056:+ [translate_table: standard]